MNEEGLLYIYNDRGIFSTENYNQIYINNRSSYQCQIQLNSISNHLIPYLQNQINESKCKNK